MKQGDNVVIIAALDLRQTGGSTASELTSSAALTDTHAHTQTRPHTQ